MDMSSDEKQAIERLMDSLQDKARNHSPEGVKPRLYGAQFDSHKMASYKGPIVAVQDGIALQKLNDRGSFVMHSVEGFESPEALVEGATLRVNYDQGHRTVDAWDGAAQASARQALEARKAPSKGQDHKEEAPAAQAKPTMGDIDNDKYRAVAERIVKSIESGNSIWQKPWKQAAAQSRPHNAESSLNYRGINRVLLMHEMLARGSNDTRFLTFNQCRSMAERMKKEGVPEDQLPHVRKGAKSIEIVKYGRTEHKKPLLDEGGHPVLDDKGKARTKTVMGRSYLQTHRVFHASDIENMPPLVLAEKKATWEIHAQAEELAARSGVAIRHEPGDRAFYRPSADTITMPEREQFKSADDYYATLMHEVGHSTGHASRLNRDGIVKFEGFGSPSYAYEELIADTASAFACAELGLDSQAVMDNHASYLSTWAERIKADPKSLFKAFSEAEQAADWVMQRHEKQMAAQAPKATVAPELEQHMDLDADMDADAIEARMQGYDLQSTSGLRPVETLSPSVPAAPAWQQSTSQRSSAPAFSM